LHDLNAPGKFLNPLSHFVGDSSMVLRIQYAEFQRGATNDDLAMYRLWASQDFLAASIGTRRRPVPAEESVQTVAGAVRQIARTVADRSYSARCDNCVPDFQG